MIWYAPAYGSPNPVSDPIPDPPPLGEHGLVVPPGSLHRQGVNEPEAGEESVLETVLECSMLADQAHRTHGLEVFLGGGVHADGGGAAVPHHRLRHVHHPVPQPGGPDVENPGRGTDAKSTQPR